MASVPDDDGAGVLWSPVNSKCPSIFYVVPGWPPSPSSGIGVFQPGSLPIAAVLLAPAAGAAGLAPCDWARERRSSSSLQAFRPWGESFKHKLRARPRFYMMVSCIIITYYNVIIKYICGKIVFHKTVP